MQRRVSMVSIVLILVLSLAGGTQIPESGWIHESKNETLSYDEHLPIVIDGNADLINQADTNDWPGDGSSFSPFLIMGLSIVAVYYRLPLINITNTDLHIQIRGCFLNGGGDGILLLDAQYITVFNNIVYAEYTGVNVQNSNDNIVNNNTISSINGPGLFLLNSLTCNITSNVFRSVVTNGVVFLGVENCHFLGNVVLDSGDNGIIIVMSNDVTVISNTFYNNDGYGLNTESFDLEISMNNFIDNARFLANATSQICIDSLDNVLNTNFYSDWTSPDSNKDSVVDIPYQVDSFFTFADPSPQTSAFLCSKIHVVSSPFILTPNTTIVGTPIYGILNVTWMPSSCTYDNGITYDISIVEYSTVIPLATELNQTFYELNLTLLQDNDYNLRIVAVCSDGVESLRSDSVVITTRLHTLTVPRVVNPFGTGRFGEFTNITWLESEDSYDHEVWYDVYYSDDFGASWIPIAADLQVLLIYWDISSLTPMYGYMVKIVARCEDGTTAEDTSDGPFAIIEHTMAIPYILTPIMNYTYDTHVDITWRTAWDSWEHQVNYTLYYSTDDGETWTMIVSDLPDFEYRWDVSELPEGDSYLLKVVGICSLNMTIESLGQVFNIGHETTVEPPPVDWNLLIIISGAVCVVGIVIVFVKTR